MGHIIKAEARQAVRSWRLFAAALAFGFLLFLSGTEAILTAARSEDALAFGFHGQLVYNALSSDTVLLALPILCALPYGAAYIEDIKTGSIKLYISRSSRRGYVLGKLAGSLLSGGLVPVLGSLAAYAVSALVFAPMEAPPAEDAEAVTYFWDVLAACGRFFLSGGFWAFLGMTLSSQMESRYIAYASPFVFYYLLVILRQRYFTALYVLDPEGWLWPGAEWVYGAWSAAVVVTELIIITALLFAAAVKRRIAEL